MRVIHSLLYAVVIVSLLLFASCCCTGGLDDDDIDPGLPGGVDNFVSDGDSDTGDYGGYSIESGITVNGVDSADDLGISDGMTSGFEGTVYGAASFSPSNVTFSGPVTLTIPTSAADGTYNVYMYSGGTWTMVGTATVSGGEATFTSTSFGSFIVGEMHGQGGGS